MSDVYRMRKVCANTNTTEGVPVWAPVKSLWFTTMAVIAIVGGWWTFSWSASVVACVLTVITLCLGHSIGLHRLLIHRSFECSPWLEYMFVYLGVLVGMGGPRRMVYLHDIRDWSQRQPACHPFYIHATPIWLDWFWQMHCEVKLEHAPKFCPDQPITGPLFYRLLDRTWMLQQLPLAMCLFYFGGWPWVVWGISVRVTVSLTGHWLVGYIAHNVGPQTWIVEGAAVQGQQRARSGPVDHGRSVAQQPSRVSRVRTTRAGTWPERPRLVGTIDPTQSGPREKRATARELARPRRTTPRARTTFYKHATHARQLSQLNLHVQPEILHRFPRRRQILPNSLTIPI